jgi:2-methylcitrate dehydratase PrpD
VHPQGTFEAMLSIHYAAAAIALWGRLGFAEFQPRAYGDERLAAVIDRVIEVNPDSKLGPLQCRIVVETTDGTRVQDVAAPVGNPDNPAPRAVLAAKFTACATGTLGARTPQVLDMPGTLEDVPDVAALCDLLRPLEADGKGQ